MKKIVIMILSGVFWFVPLAKAQFISFTPSAITIDNKVVRRVVSLEKNRVMTTGLSLSGDTYNLVGGKNNEFKFYINNRVYTGTDTWNYLSHEIENENKGEQLTIRLSDPDNIIEMELTYTVYPELPVIRKKMAVKNRSASEIRFESPDIEYLTVSKDFSVESMVYHNYARMKSVGPFWEQPTTRQSFTTVR
jgi:alpha-galactosidase